MEEMTSRELPYKVATQESMLTVIHLRVQIHCVCAFVKVLPMTSHSAAISNSLDL